MKIQAITISSREPHEKYYHLKEFRTACQRQGIVPHFLNEGPYCGLMSKARHLLKYLKREGASFDLIVSMDSWDFLPLVGLPEMEYNYKGFGAAIVFNAETNCFPRADLADKFPQSPTKYRFLNSGFFIAETAAAIQMLEEMHLDEIPDDTRRPDGSWECWNDQEFYSRWYVNDFQWSAANIVRALDYTSILSQTLHDAGEREFYFDPERKRIVSMLTHNEPCCVHGNGNGKAWLERIIRWLNL